MCTQTTMNDALRSAEDFICNFKIAPCPRKHQHDWTRCFNAHPGERARRRDLRTHNYAAVMCGDMLHNGSCDRGDACPMAHGVFEYHMHPDKFRTKLCTSGEYCNRPFCFFAHSMKDLRLPEPSSSCSSHASSSAALSSLLPAFHADEPACDSGGAAVAGEQPASHSSPADGFMSTPLRAVSDKLGSSSSPGVAKLQAQTPAGNMCTAAQTPLNLAGAQLGNSIGGAAASAVVGTGGTPQSTLQDSVLAAAVQLASVNSGLAKKRQGEQAEATARMAIAAGRLQSMICSMDTANMQLWPRAADSPVSMLSAGCFAGSSCATNSMAAQAAAFSSILGMNRSSSCCSSFSSCQLSPQAANLQQYNPAVSNVMPALMPQLDPSAAAVSTSPLLQNLCQAAAPVSASPLIPQLAPVTAPVAASPLSAPTGIISLNRNGAHILVGMNEGGYVGTQSGCAGCSDARLLMPANQQGLLVSGVVPTCLLGQLRSEAAAAGGTAPAFVPSQTVSSAGLMQAPLQYMLYA